MKTQRMIPVAVILMACAAYGAESKPSQWKDRWKEKMQELSRILTDVLVDVSSDTRFRDPANRARIESNARKLAGLAHEIRKEGVSPMDADPTLRLIETGFHEEATRAYTALRSGNRDYARDVLTGISSYCIACHTRNATGPSFSASALPEAASKLEPLERAKFLTATRQFDLALAEFEKLLGNRELARERPLDSTLATRYALAIAVRVKKDPARAGALLDHLLANEDTPFFLRQYAVQWKAELQQWKDELPKLPKTEEGLYAEALRLTASARDQQKFPADRSADVLYLRASSAIHDLLQNSPDGPHAAEAFLLAGTCYEVLRDLSLDDLHETYFEGCVRKAPGTETAQLCYRRYEQSVIQGFTGSSGTHLPSELRAHLKELQRIATGPAAAPPR